RQPPAGQVPLAAAFRLRQLQRVRHRNPGLPDARSTTWSASASSTWATRSTPTCCSTSGTVNHRNKKVLANLYGQMPSPKIVVAIGACGLSGGVFREAYNVVGGIDKVHPGGRLRAGLPAQAGGDHRRRRARSAANCRRSNEAERGIGHARRDHARQRGGAGGGGREAQGAGLSAGDALLHGARRDHRWTSSTTSTRTSS
ncbi:MAG: hypothetical protein MZV70_57760, partial [Desulfobacterales bacterium]|nr:hypothetical protein [Desulfobacterales bacterium]